MSSENQNQPIFSVQRIYTKHISFENPNAPEVFLVEDNDPKIELNLSVENKQIGDENWEVTLKVSVVAKTSTDDTVMFHVEVEQAAIFLIRNIPDEHLHAVLGVDCPTILFPYTRQLVSTLTSDGGFMPLLIDPFNFAAAYQNSLQQQQAGAAN